MDVAIFKSIQQTQISKMKDSRMIVFDLMKDLPDKKTQTGGSKKRAKIQRGGALRSNFEKF